MPTETKSVIDHDDEDYEDYEDYEDSPGPTLAASSESGANSPSNSIKRHSKPDRIY